MLLNSTDTGQNWYPAWQVMVCKRFQWMLVLWPYWTKCHFPQHNISSMYDFFKNIYFSQRLIFFKMVWNKISNFSLRLSSTCLSLPVGLSWGLSCPRCWSFPSSRHSRRSFTLFFLLWAFSSQRLQSWLPVVTIMSLSECLMTPECSVGRGHLTFPTKEQM